MYSRLMSFFHLTGFLIDLRNVLFELWFFQQNIVSLGYPQITKQLCPM
jgi:hypothetical protein